MSGILPPAVEQSKIWKSAQAIEEYFESGGSADDTTAAGQPLLYMVLTSGTGHRIERGVRAVLAGRPRNVDARWFGRTPLHKAVGASLTNLYSQLEIIDMLLDAGADIDARTSGPSAGRAGHTPLMLAAANDLPRAAEALLDQGADPYVRDQAWLVVWKGWASLGLSPSRTSRPRSGSGTAAVADARWAVTIQ